MITNVWPHWKRRASVVYLLCGSLLLLALLLSVNVAHAQESAGASSDSGRGLVTLPGPMGVYVSVHSGNLSYIRTDLPFACEDCSVPLDVSLFYSSGGAAARGTKGFHGWQLPFDLTYDKGTNGEVTIIWGSGGKVTFLPTADGGFSAPDGVTDQLESPQPGHYVLKTCRDKTYYFGPRHSHPTRIEAPNGQALVLAHDAASRLISVSDSYGRQVVFAYDGEGYLSQATDVSVTPPRTVQYVRDVHGNLSGIVDAVGHTTAFSYDGAHRLTAIQDARGNMVRIAYDAGGAVTSLTTALSARHFAYDERNRQTAVVDMVSGSESLSTVYSYDERGRLTGLLHPDGQSRALVWDDHDNPIQVTDESGEVTTYTYDAKGHTTSITDALGKTVSFTYHPVFGEMTTATDALSRTTTAEYDAHGNVVRVVRPGNRATTYEYDTQGWQLISMTDPLSRTVRYSYDSYGNNTVITDSLGAVLTFDYDAAGRLRSYTDPAGHVMTYTQDALGRLTSVTDPLASRTSYAFDPGGNLQSITDGQAGVRSYRYDSLDRLLGIIDEIGGGISYASDGVGSITLVADAKGNAVRYGYNQRGLLDSETDPAGNRTTMEYDALGQVERRTDPDAKVSTYEYDKAGQLTAERHPGGDFEYGYDLAGNIVAITGTQVVMRYVYNDADEVTAVTTTVPALGISKSIGYTYNADGSRATMTDPDGGVTAYTYDGRGQIRTITNPAGQVVTYTWSLAGWLERKDLGNGTYMVYAHDDAGQPLSIAHHRANGSVLASVAYSYDDLGNRISESHSDGRVVTYTLDARSRLVGAKYSGGGEIQYGYDLAGHRTLVVEDGVATGYAVDAAGRLQSAGTIVYGWDKRGNLVSVAGAGGPITYTYDARNKLTGVISKTGGTTAFERYPDGLPLKRTEPDGTVTLYIYDRPNLLMELDATGATAARYTSGDMDEWLSMERGGARYAYHADGLGSVLGVSDATGNLVERYHYSPFGRTGVLNGAGQPLPTSAVGNPFRFTGRQALGLGELYDYRARIYDPGTGRFLSEDPVAALRDPNRYAYALNNPTTWIDPTGEDTWSGPGVGFEAGFLFGCSVWRGLVTNNVTGEQCSIEEKCCSLGAQAKLESKATKKWFSGPREGKRLARTKWEAVAGISGILGPLSAGAETRVNTETGEHTNKVSAGAFGTAGFEGSNKGNNAAEAGAKFGLGFGSVKGQRCKRKVNWCDKKEDDEKKKKKDKEKKECDSETGCCYKGPDCDADGQGACCFLCCDGPCDPPDCEEPDPPPDPPPDGPGGDHPDENYSAASPQAALLAQPLTRDQPYIGLLWRGYALSAGAMINKAGERYVPVGLTFSPDLAQTVPVLVIPSGGLQGLESSGAFQARLAAYVEQGGTLISFSQQQGIQFGALPVPAGGDELGGYGWRQDNSCFHTSLYISAYHPVVSGLRKPTLTAHVDGYYSTLPEGTVEVLNRMKSGQPSLVIYPYPSDGAGGHVLATTIYDDWGTTHYQGSADALTLARDMLSWAYDPDEALPENGPGEAISLPVTVTNGAAAPSASVDLIVVQPDRTTAFTSTRALSLQPGNSAVPVLEWTPPIHAQLGIWWVDYLLRDADGAVLQSRSVSRRFVVSNPSPITGPDRPLSLWITASQERFIIGTEGHFTFHVYNHTDTSRTVDVVYDAGHHQTVTVGPGAEETFVYLVTIGRAVNLWGSIYEGSELRATARYAVLGILAAVQLTVQPDHSIYRSGEQVALTVTIESQANAPGDVETTLQVVDPDHNLLYEIGFDTDLVPYGSDTRVFSFTLPLTPTWGYHNVLVESRGRVPIAGAATRFEVPGAKLWIDVIQPPALSPTMTNDFDFVLEALGELDINSGVFTATVLSPGGAPSWSGVQPFTVDHGQKVTLTFPVSVDNLFGNHTLAYQAEYADQGTGDQQVWPFSNAVEASFDKIRYCAQDTMDVEVRVTNSGRFVEEAELQFVMPGAGFSQSRALPELSPGETSSETFSLSLPLTLTAGVHPVSVTLRLESGSEESRTFDYTSPGSELAFAAPPTATAGEPLSLTLSNIGCESTDASYSLDLRRETAVQTISGTVTGVGARDTATVTLPIPGGAASGTYLLAGRVDDLGTGQVVPVFENVTVSGAAGNLEASTEKYIYLNTEPVTATARFSSTGTALAVAELSLQIQRATGDERWLTHAVGDHGPKDVLHHAVAVDPNGTVWAAAGALDHTGTPMDRSDDSWQQFSSADGIYHKSWVYDIHVDPAGYKWFGTDYGASVLDDGGTPLDKSDDQWTLWDYSYYPGMHVRDITTDGAGNAWFVTNRSTQDVKVLVGAATPFDKFDDQWKTFDFLTMLGVGDVWAVGVDSADNKWFGTSWGVSVLDDGGTPLDDIDDVWLTYEPGVDMAGYLVKDIAIDSTDLKWTATYTGLQVLDDGGTPFTKGDDQWQQFTKGDGLGSDKIEFITIDGGGFKWLGHADGWADLSVLDDNGTPLDKSDDTWAKWDWTDGLKCYNFWSMAEDAVGYKWFACTRPGDQPYVMAVLADNDTPTNKADDTWTYFSIAQGLGADQTRDVYVDSGGLKWVALNDTRAWAGVSVLDDSGTPFDKYDDQWQTFNEYDDGLESNGPQSMVEDGLGHMWFGTDSSLSVLVDGGTPFDKSDDQWQVFPGLDGTVDGWVHALAIGRGGVKWYGTQNGILTGAGVLDDKGTPLNTADDGWQWVISGSGLEHQVSTILVDDAWRIWFLTYGGVGVLDDGGTPLDKADDAWYSFGSSDGMAGDSVEGGAIDSAGRKWFANQCSGISVLDDGGTLDDKSDDQWETFDFHDWLHPYKCAFDIAIDGNGRKWIGHQHSDWGVSVLDDGGTPFDKLDDTWRHITTTDGLADNSVYGIAVDGFGQKWFATQYSGVSLLADSHAPLWTGTYGVNPTGTTEVADGPGAISSTGKMLLEGAVTSNTGQVLATGSYPFYVFGTETAVTLETNRRTYRPGQTMTLSGEVRNGSGAALNGQTVTISQDGVPIYSDGPFDVPAGGSHAFSTTAAAPGSPGTVRLEAAIDGVSVSDKVAVIRPQVEAGFHAPDVAGGDAFSLTLLLTNTGQIDAAVTTAVSGSVEAVPLPMGSIHVSQYPAQLSGDTTFTATLVGDLNAVLTQDVLYGEAAEVSFSPPARSCPGWLEIPYVLSNTGQLDVQFNTVVSITGLVSPTYEYQFDSYLPLDDPLEGSRLLFLEADGYTLGWQHAFGSGQQSFVVAGLDQLAVDAVAGPALAGAAPVTVTVTNKGCNAFTGTLAIDAGAGTQGFYADEQFVDIALGDTEIYTFSIDTVGLAPGAYLATVTLLDGSGATVDSYVIAGQIPGPELQIRSLPTQITLAASETVTLTFELENAGGAGDHAGLTFTMDDLVDEKQVRWLGAGVTGTITYTFDVPPDLASGDVLATYVLSGSLDPAQHSGDMVFHVEGLSLTVGAVTDQPAYQEGDPVVLSLDITNQGAKDTGDLRAMVSFNGITRTQSLDLAPLATASLNFPLTASFSGDLQVFYGIYYAETDRSIHLNTLYLVEQRLVTVLTDKRVYQPGETVVCTLDTPLNQGALSVYAPGYETTLAIAGGAQFSFAVPAWTGRGTQAIHYSVMGTGTEEDGREVATHFDVDGPQVFVRSAALDKAWYAPGEKVTLEMIVQSDREVETTLRGRIRYPDSDPGRVVSRTVHLDEAINNSVQLSAWLTATQMGLHRFAYEFVQESGAVGLVLASGSLSFDVGFGELTHVAADNPSYPDLGDPVQAALQAYSRGSGPAQVTLTLDDGPPTVAPVLLVTGCQQIPLALVGPIPAGARRLTATLEMDGHSAQATTSFDYGTSLADLRPGAPWVAAGGSLTRTLTALVSNEGQGAAFASTVRFYDGGTEIGTVPLDALAARGQAGVSIDWDIQDQGGEHAMRVVVDPVQELDITNNEAEAVVTLPRLESELVVAPPSTEAGKMVQVDVRVENLQPAAALAVTATVVIRSPLGAVVHEQAWSESLDSLQEQWYHTTWPSGEDARPGTYSVLQEAWDAHGEHYLKRSSFILGPPPPFEYIYLPVVVREGGP